MKSFEEILKELGLEVQMVGSVYEGSNEEEYILYFPDYQEKALPSGIPEGVGIHRRPIPLKLTAEDWDKVIKQLDELNVETITQTPATGKLGKIMVRKSMRLVEQGISWRVFHRDGYRCRYCGAGKGTPLTVDHVIPWESMGPTIEANLVAACRKCNKVKGQMGYKAWLQSPYYRKASQGLSPDVLEKNVSIQMDTIPLRKTERSR